MEQTPIGKITVVKTFIVSKLIHLFSSLPSPSDQRLKSIAAIIFNFLWSGKPDKIARKRICQTYTNGGLNMINIEYFIKSLKLTWLRRLFLLQDQPWSILLKEQIPHPLRLYVFGSKYPSMIIEKVKNPFWKDILNIWQEICSINMLHCFEDIYSIPLWYNSNLKGPLFIPSWYNKGITTIGDIIHDNFTVLSEAEITAKYNVFPTDFLTFYRLKSAVTDFITHANVLPNHKVRRQLPILPMNLRILSKHHKGTKDMYKLFTRSSISPFESSKWNDELNCVITPHQWQAAFNVCFYTLFDNYLIWHQYKILNRVLGIQKRLHIMNISSTSTCRLCLLHEENFMHLFCTCQYTQQLWQDLQSWIGNRLSFNVPLDAVTIILGYLIQDILFIPFNTILLSTKAYIFWCARMHKLPNIFQLQIRIKRTYNEQLSLALLNQKLINFQSKWELWEPLFQNIDLFLF